MPLAIQSAVATALQRHPRCDSWNLFLDKLSFIRDGGDTVKTEALRKSVAYYKAVTDSHLTKTAKRTAAWLTTLEKFHGDRFRRVTLYSSSPLLLHLGRSSVLENVGIYTDRTTGLPVIPGSGLKGTLSTWATWEANQKPEGSFPSNDNEWLLQREKFSMSPHALRIFGSDDSRGSEHAGDIIFVGGFPKAPPELDLDIVNPHHDDQGHDKQHLTPNAFLSLRPGKAWDFVFYARPGTSDAPTLLDTTERWLVEALAQVGLGAKTASGYGRFDKKVPLTSEATAVSQHRSAEDKALHTKAHKSFQLAYPNDQTFKIRVLDKLNRGKLNDLEQEIPKLQKPENEVRLQILKSTLATKDFKEIRKLLRNKSWFPPDWLPS